MLQRQFLLYILPWGTGRIVTIPEMAAFRVVTLLRQHPSQKVNNKEHPVALMAPAYVLTVVAARTCTEASAFLGSVLHQAMDELYKGSSA